MTALLDVVLVLYKPGDLESRLRSDLGRLTTTPSMLHTVDNSDNRMNLSTAWNTGAIGEEQLGNRLGELASERLRVLHDRRIPVSRANIDHLAVTPSGVFVIDAKKYAGCPRLKVEGGLLRPRTEKLVVGSRSCTKLVDGVLKQVEVVKKAIGDDVPVHPVLCFVGADWPLIGGSFTTRGVMVLWPKKLYPLLAADGSTTIEDIEQTHRDLARALLPA